MKKNSFRSLRSIVVGLFVAGALLAGASTNASETTIPDKIKVFIVQSYEQDHVCGAPQGKGIEASLAKEFSGRLDIKNHFMSTKTINSTPEKMQHEARLVLAEVDSFKPDMVFMVDDDAFREVGVKLISEKYPVIFSGMNAQPENYSKNVPFLDGAGRPNSNITGVYEKLHFQTAINVMRGVIPDLKKIVALLDKSPTGNAIRVQMEKELAGYGEKIEVVFKQVGTMKDYLEEMTKINNDPTVQAVYPVVLSVVDDQRVSVGFKKTLRAYVENCTKPGMALNFDFARLGLFGGASVDFGAMGRQAGEMGVKFLQGAKISDLPIESAKEYLITFNKKNADMLHVQIPTELIGAAIIYDSIAVFEEGK
ncbi:MAG: ABC transporter substrate binding protein [Desulfuromusa sp.]|nr:ABC transporter substrate binding protein [Desulfuromusa sp.]